MKNPRIYFLSLLLLCFSLSSCKVYLNVEKIKPKVSEEGRAGDFDVNSLNKLIEGDRIILKTIDGKKHNLFYKRIHENQLIGSAISNSLKQSENTEFDIVDIEKLWVQKVSAAATVPIVLIGSLGIILAVYVILVATGDGYW